MKLDESKYLTEYQRYIIARFADGIPEDDVKNEDYEKIQTFMCILEAPEQYENEDTMLSYAKGHAQASAKELMRYFHEITPPGLPPCAVDWDDDEDDGWDEDE